MTNLTHLENHCHICAFAIPQEDSRMGLVDCPKRGYGNAFSSDIHPCEHYLENHRLVALRDAAIEAVSRFEGLNALQNSEPGRYYSKPYQEELCKAACESCAMQDAYALAFGLGYDDAAAILHKVMRSKMEVSA